jgi:hypothetical protein
VEIISAHDEVKRGAAWSSLSARLPIATYMQMFATAAPTFRAWRQSSNALTGRCWRLVGRRKFGLQNTAQRRNVCTRCPQSQWGTRGLVFWRA